MTYEEALHTIKVAADLLEQDAISEEPADECMTLMEKFIHASAIELALLRVKEEIGFHIPQGGE